MTGDLVIETKGLRKTFRTGRVWGEKKLVEAVSGVDLAVRRGEIFGFLGPNGAGKSTTQKMLSTLMQPTSGEARVAGFDLARQPEEIRSRIGFVSQAGGADRYATGLENLVLQARLYGIDRATAIQRAQDFVARFQLGSFADRATSTYSGGQRRRLDFAIGMIHRPQVLLLDEPTTGLDPQSRAYLWDEIRKLRDDGTTVFLTTHYLDEADKLCDALAIIDNGKIVVSGVPADLKAGIGADSVVFTFADRAAAEMAERILREAAHAETIDVKDAAVHLYVRDGEKMLTTLLRALDGRAAEPQAITLSKPSLDDVFLRHTGRSLREQAE